MTGAPESLRQERTTRVRRTARVVLLDTSDRILLMKGRLESDPSGPGAWFTVGGGIEPGETLAEAAIREVREETGFAEILIETLLWTGGQRYRDRNGAEVRIEEHFILARCVGGEPSRDGWEPQERELIDDIRWWSPGDLRELRDAIVPIDLAERLAGLLDGWRRPAE